MLYLNNFLCSLNEIFEADETGFSRREIIRYTTSTEDELKDTV